MKEEKERRDKRGTRREEGKGGQRRNEGQWRRDKGRTKEGSRRRDKGQRTKEGQRRDKGRTKEEGQRRRDKGGTILVDQGIRRAVEIPTKKSRAVSLHPPLHQDLSQPLEAVVDLHNFELGHFWIPIKMTVHHPEHCGLSLRW
jgi:hypothetical protein